MNGQASLDDYVKNEEYVEEASMPRIEVGECRFCRLRGARRFKPPHPQLT